MSDHNTGGPAFPIATEYGQRVESAPGMTLRDYFAAKAMQGSISGALASGAVTKPGDAEIFARVAYDVADAMLEARK